MARISSRPGGHLRGSESRVRPTGEQGAYIRAGGRASFGRGGAPDRLRSGRRQRLGLPRRGRRHGDGDHPRVEGAEVIGPSGAVRVMVATKPVDFRKGAEGLAALVREEMKANPFSGAV